MLLLVICMLCAKSTLSLSWLVSSNGEEGDVQFGEYITWVFWLELNDVSSM